MSYRREFALQRSMNRHSISFITATLISGMSSSLAERDTARASLKVARVEIRVGLLAQLFLCLMAPWGCSSDPSVPDAGATRDATADAGGVDSPGAVDVTFPPGTGDARCAAGIRDRDTIRLTPADVADRVIVCSGTAMDGRAVGTVLVFDATGRLVWAPAARDGSIVYVDDRSTTFATAFATPYLASAHPLRAEAILDEVRASPYLDRAVSAFAAGEAPFRDSVLELVQDALARLMRHPFLAEPDAVAHLSLIGTDLRITTPPSTGVDYLCEVHAIDAPAACSESDLLTWNEFTPAHHRVLIPTNGGRPRARINGGSYLDVFGNAVDAVFSIVAEEPPDDADYSIASPGIYQVVCTAGATGLLDTRDINFAARMRSANPSWDLWGMHTRANLLNLWSAFVETISIVVSVDFFEMAAGDLISLLGHFSTNLDAELAGRGAVRLGDLPFDDQVHALGNVIAVTALDAARDFVAGSFLERLRDLSRRAATLLRGLDAASSAGAAVNRIWTLAFASPTFDWFYAAPAFSCAIADAGLDAGVDGGMSLSPDSGAPADAGADTGTCSCTSGACCSGCSYRAAGFVCARDVATEYPCTGGTVCGADVYVRHQNRTCSGTSSGCDGPLVWDAPTVSDNCTSDEKCMAGDATCNYTASCACACSSGACCDGCNYYPTSRLCAATVAYEYLCSGGTSCGADAYAREQNQYCSGSSAACDGALIWTAPTVIDDCTSTETCAPGDSTCNPTASCSCACTSGACCDGCNYFPSTTICAATVAYEYLCSGGTACGADAYVREQHRYCSGSSAACDGTLAWTTPTVIDDCTSTETCAPGDSTCNTTASCSCACTVGACCDGCNYLASSAVCLPGVATEYLCSSGTGCGADAYVRQQDQHCSGASASCNGPLVWTTPTVADDCTATETCAAGDSTCNADAACSSCATAYTQGFESTTLFSDVVIGSQPFSDGAQFWDAGGTSYLRRTTSAHGGTGAMNVYTGSSGAAGSTTLTVNASAAASERLRVRFWVYNPFVSSYTIQLARAGGTAVPVTITGGDWVQVDQYVISSLSTSQLVVQLGLIPNGASTGTWTFRMDDLLVERCP